MMTGAMAVTASGVVPVHAEAILKLAREKGQHIILRPVNTLSTKLIEAGYGTKDMSVKGKSSDWGPQAGFICVDQALSKLAGSKPEEIPKFNHKVEDSIAKNDAKPVPLVISGARIQELQALRALQILSQSVGRKMVQGTSGGVARRFTLFEYDRMKLMYQRFFPQHDANIGTVRGRIPALKDCWLVLDGDVEEMGPPVEVLASPKNSIPLTADYDLFAVCPELNATTFGQMQARNAKPAMPVFGTAEERAAIAIQRRFRRNQAVGRIDKVGMAPNYLLAAVRDINMACGRGDNPVCHHGGEVDNPFPERDWELLVINGNPGARNGFIRTESKAEVTVIASEILAEGKIFYANRKYYEIERQGGQVTIQNDEMPRVPVGQGYLS